MARDALGRTIDYLRISVTERCNFRCVYCMPEEGLPWRAHAEMLDYDDIERLVRIATRFGIRRVRLTGGEPGVYLLHQLNAGDDVRACPVRAAATGIADGHKFDEADVQRPVEGHLRKCREILVE